MNRRKIFSFLIVLTLVFILGAVAFAEGEGSTPVVPNAVDPVENHDEPAPGSEDQKDSLEEGTEQVNTEQPSGDQNNTQAASVAFAITKHPYSESIAEGSVTSFVAKASGASTAEWIIQDANGNPGTSSHISIKDPYYDDSGYLVAKVVINDASVNINGWTFRARFNNSLTTDAAKLTVYYAASTATPRPVVTPVPTATPSPTPSPTPVPTATPEPTPIPDPTPLPTYTPVPTVAPAETVKEVADGGASASLGRILTVIVIAGAAAVIAVIGILAGSGILGGNKKKRRKRRR